MTITHIAAQMVCIGARCIQRCALCGKLLVDNKNEGRPLNPDGTDPGTPAWPHGHLIRVVEGNPRAMYVFDHNDGEKLPKDSCFDMVE